MNKNPLLSVAIVLFASFYTSSVTAQDWPEFLGPGGSAQSSDTVPTTWNEKENMLWKLNLPGLMTEGSPTAAVQTTEQKFIANASRD